MSGRRSPRVRSLSADPKYVDQVQNLLGASPQDNGHKVCICGQPGEDLTLCDSNLRDGCEAEVVRRDATFVEYHA